jgi:fumarate reductase subunit D
MVEKRKGVQQKMSNEPVAWAMFKGNTFMDAIHPDEHTRFEGGYTIPLYTHPAKTLTDEEILQEAYYILMREQQRKAQKK